MNFDALDAAYAILEKAGLGSALNVRLCNLAASQGKDPEEVARSIVKSARAEQ